MQIGLLAAGFRCFQVVDGASGGIRPTLPDDARWPDKALRQRTTWSASGPLPVGAFESESFPVKILVAHSTSEARNVSSTEQRWFACTQPLLNTNANPQE